MGRRKKGRDPEEMEFGEIDEEPGYNPATTTLDPHADMDERDQAFQYIFEGLTKVQGYESKMDETLSMTEWEDRIEKVDKLLSNHFKGNILLLIIRRNLIEQGFSSLKKLIEKSTREQLIQQVVQFNNIEPQDVTDEDIKEIWFQYHMSSMWLQHILLACLGKKPFKQRVLKQHAPQLIHNALKEVLVPYWRKTIELGIAQAMNYPDAKWQSLHDQFTSRIYPYDISGQANSREEIRKLIYKGLDEAKPANEIESTEEESSSSPANGDSQVLHGPLQTSDLSQQPQL